VEAGGDDQATKVFVAWGGGALLDGVREVSSGWRSMCQA
jgi:hypothetical protein